MYYGNRKATKEHSFTGASSRGDRTPSDLSSIVLRIITDTAADFAENGACPTRAFVIDGRGEGVILWPERLPDDNTKDFFAEAIAQAAADLNAIAVVLLAEAWMPGESWDGVTPPSQCVDRREVLLATAETADGSTAFVWRIHRDAGDVRLGECTPVSGGFTEGRFVGLLRRPDPGLN